MGLAWTRWIVALAAYAVLSASADQRGVDVLSPVASLPVEIAAAFQEPLAFVQAKSGQYVVLDRRAHEVFVIDAKKGTSTRILEIGIARGELFTPGALAINPGDLIAIADGPGGQARVQYFLLTGSIVGYFRLRDPVAPRLAIGPLVLNGVGSAPVRAREAERLLRGQRLTDEAIRAAADLAFKPAKPLDNTDFENAWRKKMVKVFVRDGLAALRG